MGEDQRDRGQNTGDFIMEFEGEIVNLSAPQDKLKQLMRVANVKDNEIRDLKSALQETQGLLEVARERISRLLGEKAMAPKLANIEHKKKVQASRRASGQKRRKKPGDPKRVFSPEKLAALKDNMAKARAVRSARAASAET